MERVTALTSRGRHLEVVHSFSSVRHYSKTSFSSPADSALFDQIAKEVDVVITAIGD
ncbi:MAG: hypothetical protein Ct9H300mP25_16210 [Acidobacteriota bacterium]|nr:MAG: hypothetical protein Ct9H300mP25_16210 [Acidobacteriota bacterium]